MTISNEDIVQLINRIININATFPGMGEAEAGILGTTHPATPAVTQLKNTAILFAEAYREDPDSDATLRLSDEVEGLLSVLVSMSVISEASCAELIDLLRNLVPRTTK